MPDPISQNIQGVQQLVGSKLNKTQDGAVNQMEGIEGEKEDAFSLDMADADLVALAKRKETKYAPYEAKLKPRQEANKAYYLGRQKEGGSQVTTDGQPISANLLFEAEETFLPAALSKNPEPVVFCDNTPEGNKVANNVKVMLQFHADILALRRKLTLTTRKWSLDFLGVLKHGWDNKIGDIKTEVRDAKNFIFDPNGYVDAYGDYIGMLGERITITASDLIDLFPNAAPFVMVETNGQLGTDVTYTEWWNDDYTFTTFKGHVLAKSKNPFFNPDTQAPSIGVDGQDEVDEVGQPVLQTVKANNHFATAKKPYTFLTVFNLGDQPHDETGLIEQNIPNQRRVTRRTEQIDYNLSRANNSTVFSENNWNQETAKQASRGLGLGHPILVPAGGPISESIHQLPAQGIDGSFFKELENSKTDLRTIFGTAGITATPQDEDQTARGMILNNQHDNTRIGGGIGDALEQVAINVFNWWTQLYCVFYDEEHVAAIMGKMKAVEYVSLTQADISRKLVVSVSPDSMKPHDEVTQMNQALQLWESGAIDPKTLLTVLNFPDPQNTAAQVVLWKTNPQLYLQLNFPDIAQLIQATMPQGTPSAAPGGPVPETGTEPPQDLSAPEASASLSNVPIKTVATPQ